MEEISLRLEKEGLIRSDLWFKFYVFLKGWASRLQAGEYTLSPSLSMSQIARRVVEGAADSREIAVTIPEGFNLKKIDERLAEAGLIVPGELEKKKELEGYLFPDTYRFYKDSSLEEIIAKMLYNFEEKMTLELREEIASQEKNIDQIIIMASIIEKEVGVYYDQRIVSGIFWKRIKKGLPLQSCATIAYALGEDKWRYSISDTKIDSLYNTYQNKGLPPGPICSPGLSAIKAAIYPLETSYYYFLAGPNGQTIYSRTSEEHEQNAGKYLSP